MDGAITFLGAFVLGFVAGKAPSEILSQNFGILVFVVIPVSLVVTWRGYVHTVKLLAGNRGWVRPALEGFILGAAPLPLSHIAGMLQEALAAGPPWPSIGYSPLSDWIHYLGIVSATSAVAGLIGSIYAVLLSGVNRVIIHVSS
jgi:hypothetical protein